MRPYARYTMAASSIGVSAGFFASLVNVQPLVAAGVSGIAALICLYDSYEAKEDDIIRTSEYPNDNVNVPLYSRLLSGKQNLPSADGLFNFLGKDHRLICRGGLIGIECFQEREVSDNPFMMLSVTKKDAISARLHDIVGMNEWSNNTKWLDADQIQWLEAWSCISYRHTLYILSSMKKHSHSMVGSYDKVYSLQKSDFDDDAIWWDICKKAGPLFKSEGRFPWRMTEAEFIIWLGILGMRREVTKNSVIIDWLGHKQHDQRLPMPEQLGYRNGKISTLSWDCAVREASLNGPRGLLSLINSLTILSHRKYPSLI